MGYFLSYFMHILFLTCVPLSALGLTVCLCRRLFVSLVGEWRGRPLLLAVLAPSTPLRELGHAVMAVLFWHRVTDVCFLDLRNADGELGFVEHSYHPRNPVALLGNFFYALGPLILGLLAVFAVFSLCFGGVMGELMAQMAALGEADGSLGDYLAAAVGLLPAMLHAQVGVGLKIVGFALLLVLCMGIFLSVQELLEAFSGVVIYALLVAAATGVLMLFDARVERVVLDALRGFAAGVTALGTAVLLAVAVLLALGALFWLFHLLFDKKQPQNAVVEYREE